MSGILVVCHANVCRSPLAAAALAGSAVLNTAGITSRGTDAVAFATMCPVAAGVATELRIALPDPEHRSQRLTLDGIRDADLVLTAEREQRGTIARLSPEARSRSFTMLEALALARDVASRSEARFGSISEFVAALNDARGLSSPPKHLDVPDGHRMSRRRHRLATRGIAQAALNFAELADRLIVVPATGTGLAAPGTPALG